MATHSSILAWKIPWTEAPRGLQSTGSHTVKHDWAAEQTHTHTHTHRGKTQPLLPQLSLAPSVKLKSGQFSFPSPLIPLFSPDPFHYHLSPGCPQPPTCLLASKHFPNLSSLLSLGIFLNCESDYFTLLIKKKKIYLLGFLGSQLQYKGSSVFIVMCEI